MRNQTEMKRKLNTPTRCIFKLMGISIILIAAAIVLMAMASNEQTTQYAEEQTIALTAKEQSQLADIEASLNVIDGIVMANREQLSEISLADTGIEYEKTLADFSENLSGLERHIATVETNLKSFSEVSASENTTVNTDLAAIFNQQEEIREQITLTTVTIADILSDMESERDGKFSETFHKLAGLRDATGDIQKKARAYYKALVNVITLFQEETQADHEELMETLKNDAESLNELLANQFTDLQNLLDEDYRSLIQRMDSLHGQIQGTETSIADLLAMMEEKSETEQEEIRAGFHSVVDSMAKMNADFDTTHTGIKAIIATLSESETAHHEETLATLRQVENNMAAGANQNFSRIASTLQSIQQQFDSRILNLQEDMARQFDAVKENGTLNHEETVSVIKDLAGSMAESADHNLTEITGFLQDMEDEFASLVDGLQSSVSQDFDIQKGNENTHHEETIAALINNEKNMAEIAGRNLESVSQFLTTMQSEFSTLVTKTQKDMAQNFDIARETENNHHNDTISSLTDVENTIIGNADRNLTQSQKSLHEMQDNFNALITSLKSEVARGFEDLSDIDAALVKLESNITDDAGKNLAETQKSIQSMQDRIDTLFNGIQGNMAQGFGILQGIATAYHSDTISAISDMESSLIEDAGRNSAGISNSIEDMKNQLDNSLNAAQGDVINRFTDSNAELNDALAQLTDNLTGQISQMDSRISNQYDSLSTTVNNNNTGQQQNYDSLLNEIRQDLQTVFQSVSSGKSKLASALLTKNITIKADATFQEICQAILDVPQEVVIGVTELPGTITYDYHYHADGSANEPHTEKHSTKGGCYTVPVYHAHSSGCYQTRYYHKHNDGCAGHPMWVDWMNPPYWGWAYDCGDKPQNASEKVLICSKKPSTVDAYNVGCGFSDGQITGAHIIYEQNASTASAAIASLEIPAAVREMEVSEATDTIESIIIQDIIPSTENLETLDVEEPVVLSEPPDITGVVDLTEEPDAIMPNVSGNSLLDNY